ncbi:thiol-disulfide oxidoreductase DCC family protein [Mycolicibacterium phlei]
MGGTLYFDGNCGMCTRAVYAITKRDRTGDLRIRTLQSADAPQLLGVEPARIFDVARWLDDSGDVYAGAEAINAAVSAALGTRLPLRLYRIPGVRTLQNAVYRYVASHRYRFPGTTPHCESHPVAC